ncbi:glutathione S-transferase family protein [Rhodobacterales bacterium HKCCE3408]|nr:glutathione S-transferase family protein [Rhodobacterales bacterium HKCCE3408]
MKLHMHPASITSRPVRLLIAEKGLDVDEEVVDLFTGAHHQEPYVSFNPNRLVPVLEDGDLKLTESSAILKYLADKFDMAEYPKDLKARAKVNEIMDWFNSNFYRDWGYNLCYPQLFPHHVRPSEEGQRIAVEWGRDRSKFWMQVLNDYWLGDGRPWLAGSSPTIADYFAGSIVALGDMVRFDFSAYPNVAAWLANVKAMPHWGEVSAALDGFAASLSDKDFVAA